MCGAFHFAVNLTQQAEVLLADHFKSKISNMLFQDHRHSINMTHRAIIDTEEVLQETALLIYIKTTTMDTQIHIYRNACT